MTIGQTIPRSAAPPACVSEAQLGRRARVVLADDHELLVDMLRILLQPDFTVVGAASDGESLVQMVESLKPDIALIDIGMPKLNGLEACRRINETAPGVKVVFLTMDCDERVAADAFALGARGYVLKSSDSKELLHAVHVVEQGGRYLTPAIAGGNVEAFVRAHHSALAQLSPRELEVLTRLAAGMTMKSVARQLGITPRTVAFHKYGSMEALGLKGNTDLVAFALQHHLIG